MRLQTAFLSLIALPGILHAQATGANRANGAGSVDSVDIQGHYIGEPVTRFLRLEPDAREDVDVCRNNPSRALCKSLLDAVENGARTEVSTAITAGLDNPDLPTTSMEFVLDGGKVVKITLPVNDLPELLKKLGPSSQESVIPSTNTTGAKWENHLSVWGTTGVYITLFQDNNPSVVDHRPLLEIETAEEHVREDAAARPQTVSAQ
jgi:hypothetical protein